MLSQPAALEGRLCSGGSESLNHGAQKRVRSGNKKINSDVDKSPNPENIVTHHDDKEEPESHNMIIVKAPPAKRQKGQPLLKDMFAKAVKPANPTKSEVCVDELDFEM